MHSILKKVNELSVYNVPEITQKQRNIYNFISYYIIRKYEKTDFFYDGSVKYVTDPKQFFNQFDTLKSIVWTTKESDIPCEGAIGCATFSSVFSMFYDNPKFDSFIMSMELAHHAVYEYCVDNGIKYPYLVANDVVHYAANIFKEPYVKYEYVKYKEPLDWIKFKKPVEIPIFIYNLPYIIDERARIQKEIRDGLAPSGIHEYWTTEDDIRIVNAIINFVQNGNDGHLHSHDHVH